MSTATMDPPRVRVATREGEKRLSFQGGKAAGEYISEAGGKIGESEVLSMNGRFCAPETPVTDPNTTIAVAPVVWVG